MTYQDNFDTATLDTGWNWIDPDSDVSQSLTARPGYFRIAAPNNNNALDFERSNAPRLMRTVSSYSYTIQTTVESTPTGDYAGAGLLLMQDRINFIRLERGFGPSGQSISLARYIDGNWSAEITTSTAPSVELRLERFNNVVQAAWRANAGAWQSFGATPVTCTLAISAGLGLNSAHGSSSHTADFNSFTYCDTSMSLANRILLPLARKKGETAIAGTLANQGTLLTNTAIELRRYQPGANTATELVTSTTTDANGAYRFAEPPALPAGYVYYVRYRNASTAANGLLFAFIGDDLAPIVAETTTNLPPIDLADITLGAPYDPQFIAEVNTPIQFNWTTRGIAGDSYRFNIEDSQNSTPSFSSPALGNVGLYSMNSRPAGFTTGPTYYVWYIAVDTPAGTGFSFSSGAVEFKN